MTHRHYFTVGLDCQFETPVPLTGAQRTAFSSSLQTALDADPDIARAVVSCAGEALRQADIPDASDVFACVPDNEVDYDTSTYEAD